MVEERVRLCAKCNAIVGWFALFCEQCGTQQKPPPAVAIAPDSDPLAGTPSPLSAHRAEPAISVPAADDVDARTLSRELFQIQLRLIHRHREQAEVLASAVAKVENELRSTEQRLKGIELRSALDRLSERLVEAESRWEEQQRTYNRESEEIEEECRDRMEAVGIDAYLTPDENAAVDTEFRELGERFESVDALLRDCGKAVAYGRKRAQSRYFGIPASSTALFIVVAFVTALLLYASFWLTSRSGQLSSAEAIMGLAPAALAVLIWMALAASRR